MKTESENATFTRQALARITRKLRERSLAELQEVEYLLTQQSRIRRATRRLNELIAQRKSAA